MLRHVLKFCFANIYSGSICTFRLRRTLYGFSATFYPVSQYGDWSWAVQLSPLYHGVELVRASNLGQWSPSLLVNIAVLVGPSVVGMTVAARRIENTLLS